MNKPNEYSSTNLNKYQCQHPFAIKRIGRFYESLIKLIVSVKPGNMLNIGCGEGFDIKRIYESGITNFGYCYGLDLNFDSLKIAKKNLTNLRFHAVMGDIYYLPIKLDRFNVILCLEVLEHLNYPERALKEISQHFNGWCIFSVPNEPLYRLTRMIVFKQNILKLGNNSAHINRWSKNKFSHLIRKFFTVDDIITSFPWTIVLCHKKGK
ncbi:MAG: class I SAM-dependent methyltransferase [Candidatus Hodarchaeota archaeon]